MVNKKIIIVGKSGSGKDYLMDNLSNKGFKRCLKWTTRPIRPNEKQGITYHYTDNNNFEENIDNNKMVVFQKFNISTIKGNPLWYYGITKEEFSKSDFMMLTPYELSLIHDDKQLKNCVIVYLDIPRSIREKRVLERIDYSDNLKRRFDNDDRDFYGFNTYDIKITDPEFSVDKIIHEVKKAI